MPQNDYDRIWTNPAKRRRRALTTSPHRLWDVFRDTGGDLETTANWFCLSPSYIHKKLVTAGYPYADWKRVNTHTGHWKGGRMDVDKDFRWQREAVLDRDGYRCQCCGKTDAEASLRVHHIIPWRLLVALGFPVRDVQLGEWNLVTLCRECHRSQKAHYFMVFTWDLTTALPEYQQRLLRTRAVGLLGT